MASGEMDKIRILVVDDHELVRVCIGQTLGQEPSFEVIAEVESGERAIEVVRSQPVDIVLMDIKMPGMGGLEATQRLLRIMPDIKILAVTVCDDSVFPSKLLQAGVYGYLTKSCAISEVIRAIKVIHSGQKYLSSDVASQLAIKHLTEGSESPFDRLSPRELLVAIMVSNGEKVSDIADKLCVSPKTVNSYRYRIFTKLQVENDVGLALLVLKHGLIEKDLAELEKHADVEREEG